MSEDKRVLPVSSIFEDMKQVSDVDVNQNVRAMMSIDKNLPMITNIKESILISGMDAFAQFLIERKDYEISGKTIQSLLHWYRVNQTSLRGWRAEQIERMIKAFGGTAYNPEEDVKREERMLGKR